MNSDMFAFDIDFDIRPTVYSRRSDIGKPVLKRLGQIERMHVSVHRESRFGRAGEQP